MVEEAEGAWGVEAHTQVWEVDSVNSERQNDSEHLNHSGEWGAAGQIQE